MAQINSTEGNEGNKDRKQQSWSGGDKLAEVARLLSLYSILPQKRDRNSHALFVKPDDTPYFRCSKSSGIHLKVRAQLLFTDYVPLINPFQKAPDRLTISVEVEIACVEQEQHPARKSHSLNVRMRFRYSPKRGRVSHPSND